MKLSEYMERNRLTVAELAEKIGTSPVAVVRYRNGTRRPSPRVMRRIVEVTEGAVTPNDFYDIPQGGAGDRHE